MPSVRAVKTPGPGVLHFFCAMDPLVSEWHQPGTLFLNTVFKRMQ